MAGGQATGVGVDRGGMSTTDGLQSGRLDGVDNKWPVPVTRRLGGFESEDLIGSRVDHRPGNLLLTPPRLHRDEGAFSLDPLQTLRHGGEFMGRLIDVEWPSHESMGVGPRVDHGEGALGGGLIQGATSRVTVPRDELPVEGRPQGRRPGPHARGQVVGREP